MASKSNSIDMVHGPLWGKVLKFAMVYMLTALVQQLYGAADVLVVGRYAGQTALAGVGTCTTLVNLFMNFILGLSAGATIVLGQAIGAANKKGISDASHTSIAVAIFGGLIITVVCLLFTEPLLKMIDVPGNVMGEASTYLRIISIGYVPSLVYNFGSAILRAKGDTKRALYIVSTSGVINILLNLLFVCVFKMTAAGVALATIISQIYTAVSIMYILCHEFDETRIYLHKIRIYSEPFKKIIKYGIPSGIQSSVYSFSNLLVQSSINSFGSAAIAGGSASTSITNFYNVMVNSFYHATLVFVSQNFGAKKFDRIKKTMYVCITYIFVCWIIQSIVTTFLGRFLISIFAPDDPEVIEMGLRKFSVLGYSYGLLGLMNIMSGTLRGMGKSFMNMVTSVVGVCGIRVLWVLTVFQKVRTIEMLYLCFPLSWIGTCALHFVMFLYAYRTEKKRSIIN